MAQQLITPYKRSGWIEIEINGVTYKFGGEQDALDFKFQGVKKNESYAFFNVSILGLSDSMINQLVVYNPNKSRETRRKIRVYAGYEYGRQPALIFKGIIWKSLCAPPPERWLNMTCLNDHKDDVVIEPFTYNNFLDNIFKHVAKMCGYKPYVRKGFADEWVAKIRPNVKFYDENDKKKEPIFLLFDENDNVRVDADGDPMWGDMYGNPVRTEKPTSFMYFTLDTPMRVPQLLEYFENKFHVDIWEEDGLLKMDLPKSWITGNKEKSVEHISLANGMLGLGDIECNRIVVKKRLDDSICINKEVEIKSELMPQVNGRYFVVEKRHTGHYRGEPWYTEYVCNIRGAQV